CFTCWSNMTRLLNTPINGPCEVSVASSRIDMVGGLSGLYILRMPPRFGRTQYRFRRSLSATELPPSRRGGQTPFSFLLSHASLQQMPISLPISSSHCERTE